MAGVTVQQGFPAAALTGDGLRLLVAIGLFLFVAGVAWVVGYARAKVHVCKAVLRILGAPRSRAPDLQAGVNYFAEELLEALHPPRWIAEALEPEGSDRE